MQELLVLILLFLCACLYYMLKNRLAIFFPSSKGVIKAVLEFADITHGDVFYDLGSGDGRILVEAAKHGIEVIGIEQNRLLNWIARMRTRNFKNIKIIHGDLFKQDISRATIIVAYLSRDLTLRLQHKLKKECKRGTKIILIDHPFKNWNPVRVKKVGLVTVRLYKR